MFKRSQELLERGSNCDPKLREDSQDRVAMVAQLYHGVLPASSG